MKKTRILFIYEGITTGGIWTSFYNLLTKLATDDDFCVSVMFFNQTNFESLPKNINYFFDDSFSRSNASGMKKYIEMIKKRQFISSVFCHLFKKNRSIYISSIQKIEFMESLSKKPFDASKEYDIAISFCELYTNYLVANRVTGVKKICWIHPDYKIARFKKRIDMKAFKKVDAVVSVSKASTENLKQVFKGLNCIFETVYNSLDCERIRQLSNIYAVSFNKKIINFVTVARLQNISKAFDRSIKIFGKLKKEGYSGFVWRIIGDGEDKKSIKKLIQKNNLEDNVILLGKLDNPFPFVKESDLMLLLSKYEGKPVSVEESIVLGVPSLITNYPSSYEQIVNNVNGIIVDNSKKEIENALKYILDNPSVISSFKENVKYNSNDGYSQFKIIIKQIIEE